MDDTMALIEKVQQDLEAHKIATDRRFKALSDSVDSRLARLLSGAKQLLPPETSTPWVGDITATPDNNYETKQYSGPIFAATNGYRFEPKDGNPPGTFITMGRKGRNGIIRYKRDVKGTKDSFGNPINTFVPAFPCFVVGSLNGREASGFYDNKQLPGVKRQYNYPAFDLLPVAAKYGLPTLLEDLKEFIITCKLSGNFYGSSGFLDLYLHDIYGNAALPGHSGTLNAIDGNGTKGVNINNWLRHPDEVNAKGLANGWTGATKIADRQIGGRNTGVGLKVERVNGNEFLYVALESESSNEVKYDVKAVTQWAEDDLQATLDASPLARRLIGTMANKPLRVTPKAALCGASFGSEFWYSRPGAEYDEMIFGDLCFRVNGVSYYLDGTVTDDAVIYPLRDEPAAPATMPPAEVGTRRKTRRLTFEGGLKQVKALPGSRGGGTVDGNDKGLVTNPTNSPGIMLKAVAHGSDIIRWSDHRGKLWSTEIDI